jgi:hypothetical protein
MDSLDERRSWVRSSKCAGGDCVEVMIVGPEDVAMRDSKDPDAGTLRFAARSWEAFLSRIGAGEFDL